MPKPTMMAVVLPLFCLSAPALAETAHNAQAGANGGTQNNCAATAYFAEDTGCLSSAIGGLSDDDAGLPRSAPARHRRTLPPSDDDD